MAGCGSNPIMQVINGRLNKMTELGQEQDMMEVRQETANGRNI